MIMDPSFTDFPDYTNGYQTNQFTISDQYSPDFGLTIDDYLLSPSSVALTTGDESPSSMASTAPSQEDTEFAETVKYISQILMEENMEEKPSMFYDPLGLQLTEKSFYDALNPLAVDTPDSSSSSSSFDSTNSGTTTSTPPSVDELLSLNIFRHTDSISQFNRGQEEASRFLPIANPLDGSTPKKKTNHRRESDEERSNKQSAVYKADDEEEEELSEMFDKVLLNTDHSFCQGQQCGGEAEPSPAAAVAPAPQPSPAPAPARGKKQQKQSKKETVDLRTLLILCAQAVSASDVRTSQELLKQIRQNSSPLGDGSQRMAHLFANALEARLAGTGSTTGAKLYFSALLSNSSAADVLKAYQLHLSSCPFKKFSIFLANKAIARAAANASHLHIVDFGILYGFQWPSLIQYLANRPGGPPKLRITGIEYPQRGFRPKERIEETGRRLQKYCRRFGLEFEYNAIASERWETVRVEDVGIRPGEVVAVNCLTRFKNLLDETAASSDSGSCPRNAVLGLIRRMNPAVFVQSEVNGAYNAPFFVTRFREALFHFSALFDAWDVVVRGGNFERLMYEREFYGREVMNVVACEGVDRVERPETYRQWQVRNTRAGFRSLPLDPEIMGKFREKLKAWYHKDFVMDEDNNWMLQGWKGRIVYASSCWVPA